MFGTSLRRAAVAVDHRNGTITTRGECLAKWHIVFGREHRQPGLASRSRRGVTVAQARPEPEVRGRHIVVPRQSNVPERVVSLFSPVLLLLLWEILVRIHLLDARFFPAPTSIVGTFEKLIVSKELLIDLKDTLGRVAVGLLMGSIPGLALGAAMGLSAPIRAFFKPMVAALFPIPKIAILPLIMLIFGLGEMSKYVSVAIGVVFLVLINTMAGCHEYRQDLPGRRPRTSGPAAGSSTRRSPFPVRCLRSSPVSSWRWGVALIVIVATEFVGAKTGIGYLIWQSWQTFSVEAMYCGLVTCAFLGFLAQLLLDTLQRLVIPWKPDLH